MAPPPRGPTDRIPFHRRCRADDAHRGIAVPPAGRYVTRVHRKTKAPTSSPDSTPTPIPPPRSPTHARTRRKSRSPKRRPPPRSSRRLAAPFNAASRFPPRPRDPAMEVRTVKVSNISLSASKREITEFFSFSGDIEYVEMRSESEWSQLAYVTFKDSQGADTAVLLSGATIVDRSVVITPVENYQLPPEAYKQLSGEKSLSTESAVRKAEDVVTSMLAKGFVLSKDALNLARSFDEHHNILSNATATVASLDRQYGLSEKINLGRAIVGSKVKEVDERYQVSELTKSALAAAEQKANIAGSAIMSNQYVSAGASWLTSAFGMVTKAAGDMSSMTKDKVDRAEEERKAIMWEERNGLISEYAKIHLDEPSSWEPAVLPLESVDEQKLQAV